MIDTLFFALQIIGIAVLLGWAVINDKLEEGAPSRGPLAFKHHDGNSDAAPPDRSRRPSLTRPRGRANLKRRRL